MTTQMNVTVEMRADKDVTVSAMFSLFVEDEDQASQEGERAAQLFNAFMLSYGKAAQA